MQGESLGRGSYRYSCPNCGGTNTEERLRKGLPCPRCLPDTRDVESSITSIYEALEKAGTLRKGYRELAKLEEDANGLIGYFEKALGTPAWGAQRTWARRLVRGDSFSIIAPTGVGKTTFGTIASLYLACKHRKKSYLVFPTTTLVEMVYRRAKSFASALRCKAGIIAIHSKMKKKEREEALKALENGDYRILITTASFARKNAEMLAAQGFRLVFVDDVDAVLRSAKSVDAILRIVGFTDEDIQLGLELLRLQRRLAVLRAEAQRLELIASREGPSSKAWERLQRVKEEIDKLLREAEKLEAKVKRAARKAATLIVSSATGRPRGSRVRLFRVLLGFEAGGRSDIGLRRVIDTYTFPPSREELYERVVELVAGEFPDGTLVYVPIDHGVEGAERLAEMLRERGVEAEAFHSKKPLSLLDDFAEGRLNVLVGVANYYGVLVRGIDLPARVKYALFAGVPRHKYTIDVGYPSPGSILRLLGLLADLPLEEIAEEARRHLAVVRKITRTLSPAALQMIAERILEGRIDESKATRAMWEAYNFLRNALRDPEVWRLLSEKRDVAVVEEGGEKYILVADAATYLQASGRTSRLYAGGITLGLSVVVVDNERLLEGLIRRTRWMVDAQWTRLEEVNLEEVKREIEEERKRVSRLLTGAFEKPRDLVKTALLIVESPNKARTIAGFFGQPSIRLLPAGARAYEVATGDYLLTIVASGGHVYDLATERLPDDLPPGVEAEEWMFGVYTLNNGSDYHPVYTSIKRCLNCGYQFTEERDTCPICGSRNIRDSRVIVDDLRRLAWEVDLVLIGTDPDTEGEKIGWDVSLLVRPYSRRIMRLEFHEVTRRAILEAIRNLREFDQRLVDAQIVRRVEDRWIGFTLSPLLWCHFWPRYYCRRLEGITARGEFRLREKERCKQYKYYYNLSAGRVQTPVLGWIIERYNQAKEKVNEYRLIIDSARIVFTDDDVIGDARELYEIVKSAKGRAEVDVEVKILEEKEEVLNPPPPYTTDTMIADANRYLGLGAPETMRLAQNLFELGLITYHRTDSTRVSDRGIQVAREWLEQAFGERAKELFRPRRWGEGGAHEAIRPTRPIDVETLERLVEEGVLELAGRLTRAHYRLYDLIFRRFMASQMREATATRARYSIRIYGHNAGVEVERIIRIGREDDPVSKGFTLVWHYIREHPPLPVGVVGAVLEYLRKRSRVPLYTQGDIITLMKSRGIGRPSTYAKIVETLFKRRYVSRIQEDRLVPTIRGQLVHKYLTVVTGGEKLEDELDYEAFEELSRIVGRENLTRIPKLISEERTRVLEERMDKIESGEEERVKVLAEVHSELAGVAQPVLQAYQGEGHAFSECLQKYRERRGANK